MIKEWHQKIISKAEKTLGRNLTENESKFITSRGGFLALEMIEDSVSTLSKSEVEKDLNCEVKNREQ